MPWLPRPYRFLRTAPSAASLGLSLALATACTGQIQAEDGASSAVVADASGASADCAERPGNGPCPAVRDGGDAGRAEPHPDAPLDAGGTIRDAGPQARDAGTAPDAGHAAPPLRVAVLSDLNGSYGSTEYGRSVHAAVQHLIQDPPDLVLITGDMVAGQAPGLDYEAMWLGFQRAVTTPLLEAGVPIAVTPGNHDASGYARFAEERAIFVRTWSGALRAPLAYLDDEHYPLRYSFEMGDALFIALDATTAAPLDAEQRQWVAEQLAQHAPTHPVRVVFGHLPIHPFAEGRENEILADAALEQLFEAHDVDLYLSGHHHAYFPGQKNNVGYVSMPCLGGGPRRLVGLETRSALGLVRFEVASSALQSLDAYPAPSFLDPIDRRSLPDRVGRLPLWTP